MMKNLLLIGLSILFTNSVLFSQSCDGDRYREPIFNEVTVTEGEEYGSAMQLIDFAGPTFTPVFVNQTLLFDLYEPAGDVLTERPMIILAFGGAFVFGTRSDEYLVDLCTRYAQLGYVVASIDYRLSRELLLSPTTLLPDAAPRAVLKGAHDMKAAIRFFRNSVFEGNRFRIDENQIYAGGLSAGAFCATHAAYLDKESELPPELQDYAANNGGIEGLSGTPSVSSRVAGVISLSGALGEATWLEPGDVPIVSTHGTADEVVPYGSDSVTILGINYPVDGSSVVHARAEEIGVKNAFYTYFGASHAPESGSVAYRDTGFTFTRDFMYEVVCNNSVGINDLPVESDWSIYPNPTNDVLNFKGIDDAIKISVYNTQGQKVKSVTMDDKKLNVSGLPNGLYRINFEINNKYYNKTFIKN